MNSKALKTELPDEATQLERLMAVPDTMTWAEIRKVRLANFKATEAARKQIAGDKTLLSPLGQRPKLDTRDLPLPKPKPDQD
jgi:hypothetical protein